jgi:photosystem II stability/assembly factor-like uncharacterized protein
MGIMRLRSGIPALVLIGLATRPAIGQWTNLGIFGGQVQDITAYDHAGTTEILIATSGRHAVYRLTASTWETVFQTADNGQAVTADLCPSNNGLIWAIIDHKVYTHRPEAPWDDSGWVRNTNITEAETLFAHASGMYIGGDSTVYRSTDGGQTLAPLVTLANEHIRSIALHSPTLFYAISGTTLLRCQDDGNGFTTTPVQVACEGTTVTELAAVGIDSADSRNKTGVNRFFVAGGAPQANLYRTDDGGKTWTRLPLSIEPGQPGYIRFAACRNKRRVFVSGRYSDDSGATWTSLPTAVSTTSLGPVESHPTTRALAFDPHAPNLAYYSTDWAVAKWDLTTATATELLNGDGIEDVAILDIAQVPTDASTKTIVWIASNRGLGKTTIYPETAAGTDWLFPLRPLDETTTPTTVAIHPGDTDVVFAGDNTGTIYRTVNGGQDAAGWTAVFSTRNAPYSTRYSSPEKAVITDLKISTSGAPAAAGETGSARRSDRGEPDLASATVYAAVAMADRKYEGGVYRSLDNGTTWDDDFASSAGSPLNMPVNSLLFLDNMVWAGVGHPKDPRLDAHGLYVRLSFTGTANWWKMPTGTELDRQSVQVVTGMKNGSVLTLYATTDQGVYRGRLDGAAAATWLWKDITPDDPHPYAALAVNPENAEQVYVAHDNSVWKSSDAGSSWGLLAPSGTPACHQVFSLLYDDLLIGTAAGLFAVHDEMLSPGGSRRVLVGGKKPPTTQPTGTASPGPLADNQDSKRLLPFSIPKIFGLGITESVGLWLPILVWLAITRHNRSR